MAQRRRRRARCMLHCPQRHVLGMWLDLRLAMLDPIEVARWRTACYGNRDGCTHTGAHGRCPDFIPRPDETPSPNGQHAHVTHRIPFPTSSSRFVAGLRPRPVTGKFSVSPSTAHSAILFSWQTHETRGYPSDHITAPAQTLPSLPKPFSDCSLHRHARNCHSTCT
jgi:hypothetical protein